MRAFSSFRRSRSRQSSGSISSDAASEDHIKDEEENATAAADNDSEADNKEFESLQPGGFIANRVLKLNHHNLADRTGGLIRACGITSPCHQPVSSAKRSRERAHHRSILHCGSISANLGRDHRGDQKSEHWDPSSSCAVLLRLGIPTVRPGSGC